jgi:AraC-like DNA-binding protein
MAKQVARFGDGDLPGLLLRDFRIESSVLCRSVMAAPWGFSVAAREAGSFHLLLSGQGWLEVEGSGPADPIHLRAGDVVVLPKGNGHRVKDSRRSAAPALTAILAEREVVNGELRFGGNGAPDAEIVCGTFTVESGRAPWFERLPPVVVSASSQADGDWRQAITRALRDEARTPTAGGAGVVNRWLESILGHAIRIGMSAAADGAGSGADAAALTDGRIGRAIARVQERPEAAWTLASLAAVATMSRSAFADRFRSVMGEPPVAYVRRLRLQRAERLLRTSDATLADIASRVGYAAPESLSRAFKARYGVAPSAIRRR